MKISRAMIAAVLIAAGLGAYAFTMLNSGSGPEDSGYHIHADFKVYLDGNAINFSQEKYMTEGSSVLSNFVHLHGTDGNVIHVHKQGVDLAFFFRSLNMQFNSTCLITDGGQSYCNTDAKKLRLFVNGRENSLMDKYEPQDLDRILITYGNGSDVQSELASVMNGSCLYSGKCPEKGTPRQELSCASGSGKCFPEPSKNYG